VYNSILNFPRKSFFKKRTVLESDTGGLVE